MKLLVTDIEFDFEDSQGTIDKEEQKFITETTLGLWDVESEDDLIEIITDGTGWCIRSIDYQPNAPHSLTAFM